MRLDYKLLLKSLPNLTGYILPLFKTPFLCTKCKLNVLVFEAVSKTLIGFVLLGTYASSLVIAICAVCQLIQE